MEHPLITDIENLTVDELQGKISELNKKLAFAQHYKKVGEVIRVQKALPEICGIPRAGKSV